MKKIFLYYISLIFPFLLSAQPEFTFQLYGGYSWHSSGDVDLSLPPYDYRLAGLVWDSESFVSPQFYAFSAGYLIDWEAIPIRVSLEYIHDKVFLRTGQTAGVSTSTDPDIPAESNVKMNTFLDEYSMAYGYNHLLIKVAWAFWRPLIGERNLRLFVGAGVGMVSTHVASLKGEQYHGQYEWHGPTLIAEVTGEFPISYAFVLCAGAKYLVSRVDQAGIINDGKLSANFHSLQAVVGAGYLFK